MTKRKLFSILTLVGLVVSLILAIIPTDFVMAAPSMKDSHAGAASTDVQAYGADRFAFQTFTASSSYVMDSIRPHLYRTGLPGNVTVELYRVGSLYDGSDFRGHYIGTALSTGSANTSGLGTTEGTMAYLEVTMDAFYIKQGDKYAFVITAPDGDSSNKLHLRFNTDGMAGGHGFYTISGGGSWFESSGEKDMRFQVWGEALGTYPTVSTLTPTGITNSDAQLNGSLTDLGTGATTCNVSFEWDYYVNQDDPQYSTTIEGKGSTGTFDADIELPVGGRPFYCRAVVTNDLGNTAYGETIFFNSVPFPVTVVTKTVAHLQGAITHAFQRKAVYASGRHWIFAYLDPLDWDTRGFYFTSSTNGINWDDWTLWWTPDSRVSENEADEFGIFFDGTYLHIAYVLNRWYETPNTNDLMYRRGIPNSDGTITWAADWQIARPQDDCVAGYPSVAVDSSGHAYISFWLSTNHTGTMDNGIRDAYVIRNDNANGTWATTSGYPVGLYTTGSQMFTCVLSLGNSDMYVITTNAGTGGGTTLMRGHLYDGSSWDTTGEIIDNDYNNGGYSIASSGRGWTASSWGDSIVLAYQTTEPQDGKLIFREYQYGVWGSPVNIIEGLDDYSEPSLCVNAATRDVYVFWPGHAEGDYYHYIRYLKRIDNVWDTVPTNWIDESFYLLVTDVSDSAKSCHIATYPEVYSGYIAVYYQTGSGDGRYTVPADTGKPTDIRMAFLQAEAGAAVETYDASEVGTTTATLQGYLVNTGGQTTQVCFEWGASPSYGSTTTWQTKATGETFSAGLTGLIPSTTYYFRALAKWADGTTTHGSGKIFATSSAGTPSVSTGTVATVTQSSSTIQGTVTSMGDYDTVYVYFEWGLTASYEQSPTSEQTKTSTGGFSVGLTGLSSGTLYYYRAALRYGSTTIYGSQQTFTTTAESGEPGVDAPDILRIDDVKVYSGYFEDGDQLYVINCRIIYIAGDPGWDIGDYFDFVLMDGALIRAKIPVKSWGYRPGSIYLQADSALTWGSSYTVKIVGNPGKWDTPPTAQFVLTSGDWQGDDLAQLDTWVTSLATSIEGYYDVQMVDYYEGKLCLTNQGAVIFGMGIPGLCVVRPRLCSPYAYISPDEGEPGTIPPIDTDAMVGPEVSEAVSDVAAFLNMDDVALPGTLGFGFAFFGIGILLTVLLGSWGTMAGAAGMGFASPVVIFGAYLGYIPWPLIIIIAAIAVLYSILVIWVKGV